MVEVNVIRNSQTTRTETMECSVTLPNRGLGQLSETLAAMRNEGMPDNTMVSFTEVGGRLVVKASWYKNETISA